MPHVDTFQGGEHAGEICGKLVSKSSAMSAHRSHNHDGVTGAKNARYNNETGFITHDKPITLKFPSWVNGFTLERKKREAHASSDTRCVQELEVSESASTESSTYTSPSPSTYPSPSPSTEPLPLPLPSPEPEPLTSLRPTWVPNPSYGSSAPLTTLSAEHLAYQMGYLTRVNEMLRHAASESVDGGMGPAPSRHLSHRGTPYEFKPKSFALHPVRHW